MSDSLLYIEGYASIFNYIDKHYDIIIPEAFNNIKTNQYIPLLVEHYAEKIIGRVISITKDDVGLYIKAFIVPTKKGIDTYKLIKNKALKNLSIGFNILKTNKANLSDLSSTIINTNEYQDKINQVNIISKLDLIEVSCVTFAANDQTIIY